MKKISSLVQNKIEGDTQENSFGGGFCNTATYGRWYGYNTLIIPVCTPNGVECYWNLDTIEDDGSSPGGLVPFQKPPR